MAFNTFKTDTAISIDIQALKHNMGVVRGHVGNALIFAVVKANAYGHGLGVVIRALPNADGFCVFSLDEAAIVREAFPAKPLVWLAGFSTPKELECVTKCKLIPLVHHKEQIQILKQHRLSSPIDIFLKINTGMNRLGFLPEKFHQVYQWLMNSPKIKKPFTLMSHFSKAEEINSRETAQQIHLFDYLTTDLNNPLSLANTAAIWAWPKAIRDHVRPGISLYGISPFKDKTGVDLGLRPVMTFRSKLIAINLCKKNTQVGYGGVWIAPKDTYLGVVDVGYFDGYSRHAKNGTPVLINDTLYPMVGRVSMNMITVDLGSSPKVNVNDAVTLWGEGLPVEVIAKYCGTIPYTLITGIPSHIKSSY